MHVARWSAGVSQARRLRARWRAASRRAVPRASPWPARAAWCAARGSARNWAARRRAPIVRSFSDRYAPVQRHEQFLPPGGNSRQAGNGGAVPLARFPGAGKGARRASPPAVQNGPWRLC